MKADELSLKLKQKPKDIGMSLSLKQMSCPNQPLGKVSALFLRSALVIKSWVGLGWVGNFQPMDNSVGASN